MAKPDAKTKARPFRPLRGVQPDEVACLEVVRGNDVGRVHPVRVGTLTLGRSPSADISLSEDGVSRYHAKLVAEASGTLTLVDLDSTNGTYLNRGQVERARVREGDEIQIGPDVTLRFGYRRERDIASLTADADPSSEPPPLTARELEVARRAARGKTNAEIGRELGISPRTVNSHLTKIYQRLELHSRAALALLLTEHGLMEDDA